MHNMAGSVGHPEHNTMMSTEPPHSPAGPSPFDELDGPEGFVHVSHCDEETKVEHGVLSGLVAVLQPHKIPEGPLAHHLGHVVWPRDPLVLLIVSFARLSNNGRQMVRSLTRRAHM